MSTPTESGPSQSRDGDRRPGLGSYLKRVSSVFRKKKPSKDATSTTTAPPVSNAGPVEGAVADAEVVHKEAVSKEAVNEQVVNEEAATEQAKMEPITATAPATAPTPSLTTSPRNAPVIATQPYDRTSMQQERARALFAKYGLILETHETFSLPIPATTTTTPLVQRIERPIRMRVHRSCHHCGSMYGSSTVCPQCEHKRCKKCPRYPDKKKPATIAMDKGKAKGGDVLEKPRRRNQLTITKKGCDVVYQPTKQRVRRTCHKCDALFIPPTATLCAQCSHVRCTRCPREPAKREKWPTGYPGDVEAESDSEAEKQVGRARRTWRKPRMQVRWECEECCGLFVNGQVVCTGCGHERCASCTRFPPKKVKTEPQIDAQVVAAVEAKLRALTVASDSAA